MKLIKEIKSKKGELHFRRWKLFSIFGLTFCIHGIYKADEDEHLHNHPWKIWTMVLSGGYYEELEDKTIRLRNTLHMAYNNESKFHKIKMMCASPTYTLAIMGKRKEEPWGYKVDGEFVDHINYRKNKAKK